MAQYTCCNDVLLQHKVVRYYQVGDMVQSVYNKMSEKMHGSALAL